MSETPVKALCTLCARHMFFFHDTPKLQCAACGTINAHPEPSRLLVPPKEKVKVPNPLLQKAHSYRDNGHFERAEKLYHDFLSLNPDDPDLHEAHWGLSMCHFGVQFVDDPNSGSIMPTVHFTSPDRICEYLDYTEAVRYAPEEIRAKYVEYGQYIDSVMNRIRELARTMDNFDIFLCYKHSDPDHPGQTTTDYTEALKIYAHLEKLGYKVFLADITLKQHVGANYEAMIYHALHSSKVLLLLCSQLRHIESAWVKSEWTRFLRMEKQDPQKCLFALLYDMDPGTLPAAITGGGSIETLVMDAFGFTYLVSSLENRIVDKTLKGIKDNLEKARFSLQTGSWAAAESHLQQVRALIRPEKYRAQYSELHLYSLMHRLHVHAPEELRAVNTPFFNDSEWLTAIEYADAHQREYLTTLLPDEERLISNALEEAESALEDRKWSDVSRPFAVIDSLIRPQEHGELYARYMIYRLMARQQVARPAELATCGKPVEGTEEWQTALTYASPELRTRMEKWLTHLPTLLERLNLRNITYHEDQTEATLNARCCTSGITTLTLPEGVVAIGPDAFCECSSLHTLRLPRSLRAIEPGVIDCSHPSFVVEMYDNTPLGGNPFVNPHPGCIKLIPSGNPTLQIKDDLLLQTIGGSTAVIACLSHKNRLSLPQGVTQICSNAFSSRDPKAPASIVLPGSVTQIDSSAFLGNLRLKTIQLNEGLRFIGASAFAGCTELSEIRLPQSVETIGDSVFEGCTKLTRAIISGKLSGISDLAFNGCTSLSHIEMPADMSSIGRSAFQNCPALTRIHLPSGLNSLGMAAFHSCIGLTEITLPRGVTMLPEAAFMGCIALRDVHFSGAVSTVSTNAFNGCTSLTKLQFSEGLQEIGSHALANCPALERLQLPLSVKSISNDCLYGHTQGRLTLYAHRNSEALAWAKKHAPDVLPPVSRGFFGVLGRLIFLLPLRIAFHMLLLAFPLLIACNMLQDQAPMSDIIRVCNGQRPIEMPYTESIEDGASGEQVSRYYCYTASGTRLYFLSTDKAPYFAPDENYGPNGEILEGPGAAIDYCWNHLLMPIYRNPGNSIRDVAVIGVSLIVAALLLIYLISCIRFVFKKKRQYYNPYSATNAN